MDGDNHVISFLNIRTPCNRVAVLQVNFTLVAGNMEDVFKIKTVNHTYGEVYVNAPLDRESVDRYLLKVRKEKNIYTLVPHIFLCVT